MSEEHIRVDGKLDKEDWEELTEYIDENKDSRKHSKQFYLEKIKELALSLKRKREEEERETHESYKELRENIKEDLDI
jgi:hypothetical protein